MHATELISRLQHLVKHHGDMRVVLDVWQTGLNLIEEVDVDVDDTGIMIWGTPKHEDE